MGTETNTDSFETLVRDLSVALGPSSGLDSSDIDPMKIQLLMEKYNSNSDEWSSYALGDSSRTYTRNLIDEGNGKSNLVSRDKALSAQFVLDHVWQFLAHSRMESWEGQLDPWSCKCTLRDEGICKITESKNTALTLDRFSKANFKKISTHGPIKITSRMVKNARYNSPSRRSTMRTRWHTCRTSLDYTASPTLIRMTSLSPYIVCLLLS